MWNWPDCPSERAENVSISSEESEDIKNVQQQSGALA